MKANFALVTLFAALVTFPAAAQYVGPGQGPTNVKELLAIGQDHAWLKGQDDLHAWLKGRIVSRSKFNDLYEFEDGSGRMLVRIRDKHWPAGLKVDDKTVVEIYGEFDHEFVGPDRFKVDRIRVAQPEAPVKEALAN